MCVWMLVSYVVKRAHAVWSSPQPRQGLATSVTIFGAFGS